MSKAIVVLLLVLAGCTEESLRGSGDGGGNKQSREYWSKSQRPYGYGWASDNQSSGFDGLLERFKGSSKSR